MRCEIGKFDVCLAISRPQPEQCVLFITNHFSSRGAAPRRSRESTVIWFPAKMAPRVATGILRRHAETARPGVTMLGHSAAVSGHSIQIYIALSTTIALQRRPLCYVIYSACRWSSLVSLSNLQHVSFQYKTYDGQDLCNQNVCEGDRIE